MKRAREKGVKVFVSKLTTKHCDCLIICVLEILLLTYLLTSLHVHLAVCQQVVEKLDIMSRTNFVKFRSADIRSS